MGLRGLLAGVTLRRRSATRSYIAWAVAVGVPAVLTLTLMPFRSSIGLTGFLIWMLLGVVVVAVVGGVRAGILALALGFVSAWYYYAPPYNSFHVSFHPELLSLIAYVVVGAIVGALVDQLAQQTGEQAALRHVATLVARVVPTEQLFASITEEVGRVFGADLTNLLHYEDAGTATIAGSWSRHGDPLAIGARIVLEDNSSVEEARSGRPAWGWGVIDSAGRFHVNEQHRGGGAGFGTPIMVNNLLWGAIVVSSKPGGRLPRDVGARLAQFAALVAVAVENAESRAALAASRARVVTAADEARRRIERDLHDGAQQRLVSLGLELRTLEASLPSELPEARSQLSEAVRGLTEVAEELQEIARGLHPAVLSKGGLGPAVKALVRRSAVPVDLNLHVNGRLPDGIEMATYYVISEALTNAAKHANASAVQVDLEVTEQALQLVVTDDGAGGADPERGSGLMGLRDRVESLGGEYILKSPPGHGTSLRVVFPIGPLDAI